MFEKKRLRLGELSLAARTRDHATYPRSFISCLYSIQPLFKKICDRGQLHDAASLAAFELPLPSFTICDVVQAILGAMSMESLRYDAERPKTFFEVRD